MNALTYLKSMFATLDGQGPSFVRWLLFLGVAPFMAIAWEEVFYFAVAHKFVAIDGNVVALATAIGGILSVNFGFARYQESKEIQSNQSPQPPQQ
jgi:hypothetical protein